MRYGRNWPNADRQQPTLSRRKRRSEADIQIDRDDAQIEPAPLRDPVRLSVHSITSSARSRSDWGIVKPSAFAVLRLTDTSSLLGC